MSNNLITVDTGYGHLPAFPQTFFFSNDHTIFKETLEDSSIASAEASQNHTSIDLRTQLGSDKSPLKWDNTNFDTAYVPILTAGPFEYHWLDTCTPSSSKSNDAKNTPLDPSIDVPFSRVDVCTWGKNWNTASMSCQVSDSSNIDDVLESIGSFKFDVDPSHGTPPFRTDERRSNFEHFLLPVQPTSRSLNSASHTPSCATHIKSGRQQQQHSYPSLLSANMPNSLSVTPSMDHPTLTADDFLDSYRHPTLTWNLRATSQPADLDRPITQAQHLDESDRKSKRRKPTAESKQPSAAETFSCSVCTVFSGDVRSLMFVIPHDMQHHRQLITSSEHMRCHDKSHACKVLGCSQRFSTARDLTRHVKSAHSNTALICSICSAVIKGSRLDNLKRHIRNRHATQATARYASSDKSLLFSPTGLAFA